jgi:hypothetical protein
MVPRIVLDRLARLRARERAVRLAWGAARLVAVAFAALVAGGLVDWLIDLRIETPVSLRTLMLLGQVGLWIGAAAQWIVRPLLAPLADRELTLWVEEKFPEFGHRLITAVELNREGAKTEGMSAELLGAATGQAVERTERSDFASRVDLSRLKRGLGLAGGAVAVGLLIVLSAPATSAALLARQFLADRDIPRSVAIAAELERGVHPSGEEVRLRFRATGAVPLEGASGVVVVEPAGLPAEEYLLSYEGKDEKGAVFRASIPPTAAGFTYRARLKDGRTRRRAEVVYEPRPVVQKLEAWVLLPAYVGLRAGDKSFEQYRVRGEIAAPAGSSARLEIGSQKQVVKAAVELLGRPVETGPEQLLRTLPLAIGADGMSAQGAFDLRPGETAYRVLLEDRNGFGNASPPKRGIAILPDEPPRVVLLPERFGLPGEAGLTEDAEVEGMPIPLGSAIRIAYYAAHPYGMDRARLVYRVLKSGKSGEDPGASVEAPWQALPLGEVRATPEAGAFDLRRGCFENTGFRDQVEFHPLPSPDPERVHGRVEGGGCFDFQTRPIPGLQVGDQIEFAVEVYARNPALSKQPGRSEARLKAFVTQPQFVDWILQTLRHESRIRQLESRQRSVFAPEGTER